MLLYNMFSHLSTRFLYFLKNFYTLFSGMFYPYFISILTRSCLALNFQQLFSTFIVTSKNPFQIGCTDGIFVFQIMFSYGLRSKCADLWNSYNSHSKKPLYFSLIIGRINSSILWTHQKTHLIGQFTYREANIHG